MDSGAHRGYVHSCSACPHVHELGEKELIRVSRDIWACSHMLAIPVHRPHQLSTLGKSAFPSLTPHHLRECACLTQTQICTSHPSLQHSNSCCGLLGGGKPGSGCTTGTIMRQWASTAMSEASDSRKPLAAVGIGRDRIGEVQHGARPTHLPCNLPPTPP